MDALQAMADRVSYRGRFLADPVPREDLRAMVRAGLSAPSGCNKQTTSILAVDDPAVLEKLFALLDHRSFPSAPAMLCVLTRRILAYRDRCYSMQDYSAAIENLLLAVTALGYATCWLEGHITDADAIGRRMADVLHVPAEYELVCVLPLGRPAEEPIRVKKLPFAERAFLNDFSEHFDGV